MRSNFQYLMRPTLEKKVGVDVFLDVRQENAAMRPIGDDDKRNDKDGGLIDSKRRRPEAPASPCVVKDRQSPRGEKKKAA